MFRFMAVVWNTNNYTSAERAMDLSRRIESLYSVSSSGMARYKGLAVHWADARTNANGAHLLSDLHGVVLGKLFTRDSTPIPARPVLTPPDTMRITASGGRELLHAYWGRYVAFLNHPEGTTRVILDPTATLPCFLLDAGDFHVVFSSAEDCVSVGLPMAINWALVPAQAASAANERLAVTGLVQVTPIHGGECVTLDRNGIRREFYWDPYKIAESDPIEDPVVAAEQMRDTVRSCVHAWASCYDGILLRLSGGIDSSIVAACLGDAPTRAGVTCFTHHSPGYDSDERVFARAAATKAGFELIEHPRKDDVRLDAIRNLVRHPHPFYARYAVEYSRTEAAIAESCGATAIFSGEWGDALFYVSGDMQPAIDYAWRHRLSPRVFGAALDTSRREGHVIWSVLATAISQGWSRKAPPDPWTPRMERHRALLTPEIIAWASRNSNFRHPWHIHRNGIAPGKFMHIYDSTLHDLQPFYDPIGASTDPDQVAPLNSQPIVELCFRIPTYLHTLGGWERAIARRAFLSDVPRPNITRRTKGAADDHLKFILMKNIDFVRDVLLEGRLASDGIIDRRMMQEVLSGEPTKIVTALPELYWYLCVETWISRFSGLTIQRAA